MSRVGRAVLGGMVAFGLLAAVPAAVFAAQPACGDTLTANTTLTANLDCSAYAGTALTLGAKGITLNLGGHTLTGYPGDDDYVGVYTEKDKTTITNGTINDAGFATETNGSSQVTLSGLTLNAEASSSYTDDVGIYMLYGTSNTIKNVTANGYYYDLELDGNASTTLTNNTFTADEYGVYAEYESHDTYSHNTAHAPYGFYDLYSGGDSYTQNQANGGSTGFYLYCDDYGQVTAIDNTANSNSSYGIYTYYCYVYPPAAPHTSLIKSNTANDNGSEGIYDYYSVGATITMNTASGNGDAGFYLEYPADLHVTKNVAKHNGYAGIDLANNYAYSEPAAITGNVIRSNSHGIYANYGVSNNTVCKGNSVRNNPNGNFHGIICS